MDSSELISRIKEKLACFGAVSVTEPYADELEIRVERNLFKDTCVALHAILVSPVMMLFAVDGRLKTGKFEVRCVFADLKKGRWVIVRIDIPQEDPSFESLAKTIHSASLFEREIGEMFGITAKGSPDSRRLSLHDEVWPADSYPLRKDFTAPSAKGGGEYVFGRVEGEGVFEVPVGPVHAGIIGPGHFRFSVAGEPIINLEPRLGFTHRGVEKLFEGKSFVEALRLAERVAGDSSFAHSLAFVSACEKICGITVSRQTALTRAILLELERMYNHAHGIAGMAIDVGFSFPSAYGSIIKEEILQLNEKTTASRYLRGVNTVGGVSLAIDKTKRTNILGSLAGIERDFDELVLMVTSSVSFMDRADTTGILRKKTAEDLGVIGLVGRASGINVDARKNFPGINSVYKDARFKVSIEQAGDCLARLKVRITEFKESCRLIRYFLESDLSRDEGALDVRFKSAAALGCAEGWRGSVLYWLKADSSGTIERCKIVDPSFHNWQGLSYAALGNIVPDFPLCNKSFDLSYSGNDL